MKHKRIRRRGGGRRSATQLARSTALSRFDHNMADFDRLLELHTQIGGEGRGRRYNIEVLNKGAILLLFASWESYCEDVVSEFLKRLVSRSSDSKQVPAAIKKYVAKELDGDKNEIAFWRLVGAKWKKELAKFLVELENPRNRAFNTPRADIVDDHFDRCLGIRISARWKWTNMTSLQSSNKLKTFIELRGAIAHRQNSGGPVRRSNVTDYGAFIRRLVTITDQALVKKFNGSEW
jgi:hypothetical protein